MSDTPLADALKGYYCFSHLDWYYLCCEVERENAKLHAEVKVTRQNYETYKRENSALREWVKEEGKRNDVCTYGILKEICEDCKCSKRTEAQP